MQFPQNKSVEVNQQEALYMSDIKTQISAQTQRSGTKGPLRYLKVKFILAKDNNIELGRGDLRSNISDLRSNFSEK